MGGVDHSDAFGMKKIDFQEVFHLAWEKIYFFPTSGSTGREGFKRREQPTKVVARASDFFA